MPSAIVWFRNDLRLADNPALQAALRAGLAPLPVYIHAPEEEGAWAPGAASNAWRARSLEALDARLRVCGSRLHVFRGPSLAVLQRVAAEAGVEAVFWNRRYEPSVESRDAAVKQALRRQGVRAESHGGALLFEPWQLQTRVGDPFRVFTPFWRSAQAHWGRVGVLQGQGGSDAPERLPAFAPLPGEVRIPELGLSPRQGWDAEFWRHWTPGEAGALAALQAFATRALDDYASARDLPAVRGTSRLSPHLHFGEIAPWRVVQPLQPEGAGAEAFVRELGWREFAHHVLHHFPHTMDRNFDPRFDDFDWATPSPAVLDAWRHGRSGIPIVDAGMRELWGTGWMHNRVRMIVASLLTKHLRAHWLHGARWFWDTLVDADLASNSLGWQWTAGTGVDAAPYFRVFNPVLQSQRFDPQGDYIARWIPELAGLPAKQRHAPWLLPAAARPRGYPATPIVDLVRGREAALAAFARLRGRSA